MLDDTRVAASEGPGTRVLRALAGLELALLRHRGGARARLGVTEEELTVLSYLGWAGATAQVRLLQLSALSRSGMDAMLQRLEQRGLLERAVDPADRRLRVVALTEHGRAQVERAFRARDEAALRAAAGRTAVVVDALARLVAELAEAAEASAEDPGRIVTSLASAPGGPIWRRWA